MKQEIFDDCLYYWNKSDGHTEFWSDLAKKWGYPTSESIRQEFKYYRKKSGIRKENSILFNNSNQNGPKILLLDIECSPILAYTWGLWEQNINTDAIVHDWYMLSWSAKWIFDSKIQSDVVTSKESIKQNDERILNPIWNLLNEADIVIGHNCSQFDVKKLNTRFLKYSKIPPKPFQMIDTLTVARSVFAFSSNKLDYINQYLGLPQKEETDISLWIKCMQGDNDALNRMLEYNKNDVAILEDLYLKMRPYIKNHPNFNIWSEENISVCPKCGSKHLDWNDFYYTYTGKYKSFRCNDCGATGRSKENELTIGKRKSIVK